MSEFGIKIKNYQAASIYEYQIGIRDRLDQTDAMLVNSLFKDFLVENGLTVKGESTRDIICVQFDYGTQDYETYIERLKDNEHLREKIEQNKELCKKINRKDLRTLYYKDGLTITYRTYNRIGNIIATEDIHYRMLYRTPGKAKKGTVMFIRDELYEAAHTFLYMGIQLPEENAPIVEIGAYSSLITSGIVGKVQIKPEQMLIVKDVDAFFTTNIIEVGVDENKHCVAKQVSDYKLKNTMFDGQALIDYSIFPEWADGYVLLRHHFTKCAAFCTNIQLFMQDYFGDQYETATVKDMWGRDVRVKDIKLITTDNAIKWLKFNISFEYWAEWLAKNDYMFGIVKTAHPSKLGNVQRMSYQMNNALAIETMEQTTRTTVEYIEKLKSDNNVFIEYLKKNVNFSNDYNVLVALVEHNPDFVNSDYFRDRKRKIIETYVLNFKSGRSIQNADNLTIVGSPYAMLLHSVGGDAFSDPTFAVEDGAIQCWTARFEDGEYLAEFRSPFNSRSNLGYMHNHHHEYFDRYFRLGNNCIAVNMNGTDFQDKNNGSDQDSDSIYTTNQPEIVAHAKYCCANYPTIVNTVPKMKNVYDSSLESFAKVDNELAAAQLAIGESSNLAQLCLTYSYNFEDQKYQDYVSILSVLAQISIDNCKRRYDIDINGEIRRIKKDMDIDEIGLPFFWQITKKDKRKARNDEQRRQRNKENKDKIKKKLNTKLVCPMNYIYSLKLNKYRNENATIPISEFFVKHELTDSRRKSKKVEALIEKYSLKLYNYNSLDETDREYEEYLLLAEQFDELVEDIRSISISKNYVGLMSYLIDRAFMITPNIRSNTDNIKSKLNKNRTLLLSALYEVNKEAFLQCFIMTKPENP